MKITLDGQNVTSYTTLNKLNKYNNWRLDMYNSIKQEGIKPEYKKILTYKESILNLLLNDANKAINKTSDIDVIDIISRRADGQLIIKDILMSIYPDDVLSCLKNEDGLLEIRKYIVNKCREFIANDLKKEIGGIYEQ